MDTLLGDITTEAIGIVYKECRRKRNKKKISYIVNSLTGIIMGSVQPYMYAIMAILIILFLMNCFQFFYYIKMNIAKTTEQYSTVTIFSD